jgi:hypothetical protein|tara:strand:+ start:463 stop:750 length:288 start_codon:yes stop_codon:yes gene_type:complete
MIADLIAMFGAKACCIGAAGTGGICNAAMRRKTPVRDILTSVLIGWVAAEFFIPALMAHFLFGVEVALAIAFVCGYSGVRLMSKIEGTVLDKIKF